MDSVTQEIVQKMFKLKYSMQEIMEITGVSVKEIKSIDRDFYVEQKGIQKGKQQVAVNMIKKNREDEEIMEYTGLEAKQLSKLRLKPGL